MIGPVSTNRFFAGMRPGSRGAAVALMTATSVLAVTGADAAQQRPQFNVDVELVQLQVGIADARGSFVRGLTADDFVVVVDGEPRPAQVAYEIDLRTEDRRGVAAMAGPRLAAPERPVAARRHFLLFFDFSFTTRRGVLEARSAALDFVARNIRASDLIGVATASRYGINLLTPFTSNHEQVDRAIQGLGLANAGDVISGEGDFDESIQQAIDELQAGQGGDAGALSALPAMEFREYVANVTNYTEQLTQFGEMLQAIEGRKHFVMFSAGFEDRALVGASLDELSAGQEARAVNPAAFASDPEMAWGAAEVRDGMQQVVEVFRSADAVVHAIDPSGMRSQPAGRQALTFLATGTGGQAYWNMNDLSVALTDIEETTSSFYMIAYSKSSQDAGTVDIEVRVDRPGVRVTSAPERLTPPPDFADMNDMQRQMQLAEVMADAVDRRDIAFDSLVTTFPARGERTARAALVLEINGLEIDRIARRRGTDEVQFEIAGFALADDDAIIDEFRRKVRVDVAAMRDVGQLQDQAFRYSDYVDVPAGEGRLRLLLREAEVGELSATTQSFYAYTAEAGEGMIVARPMIVDDVTTPPLPDPEARFDPLEFEGRRFAPIAAPSVVPGGTLEVLVIVYNIPRHPVSGQYIAGLVLELEEAATGESYRLQDFKILGTSSTDEMAATRMLVQVEIPGHIRPGDARLWARIVDQVSGNRREEQTALFINPQ